MEWLPRSHLSFEVRLKFVLHGWSSRDMSAAQFIRSLENRARRGQPCRFQQYPPPLQGRRLADEATERGCDRCLRAAVRKMTCRPASKDPRLEMGETAVIKQVCEFS